MPSFVHEILEAQVGLVHGVASLGRAVFARFGCSIGSAIERFELGEERAGLDSGGIGLRGIGRRESLEGEDDGVQWVGGFRGL